MSSYFRIEIGRRSKATQLAQSLLYFLQTSVRFEIIFSPFQKMENYHFYVVHRKRIILFNRTYGDRPEFDYGWMKHMMGY